MNVFATCILVAAVSCWLSSDVLILLRDYITETLSSPAMPEPGTPRRSPQGTPYDDLPHIVNADGQYLFCRYWEPDGQPRSVCYVALQHGDNTGVRVSLGQDIDMYMLGYLKQSNLPSE